MRFFYAAVILIPITSCRKDACDSRCPYVGEYNFAKHEWSTCDGCPPEYNTDTTYYFTDYISLEGSENLIVGSVGTYYFLKETKSLRPGPPPYYGNENPKGYFLNDTVIVITSSYNYSGHQGGWTVTGTKIN